MQPQLISLSVYLINLIVILCMFCNCVCMYVCMYVCQDQIQRLNLPALHVINRTQINYKNVTSRDKLESISLPRKQLQLQFHGGSSNGIVGSTCNGKEIISRNFISSVCGPYSYKQLVSQNTDLNCIISRGDPQTIQHRQDLKIFPFLPPLVPHYILVAHDSLLKNFKATLNEAPLGRQLVTLCTPIHISVATLQKYLV